MTVKKTENLLRENKKAIEQNLRNSLQKHEEISFAYLHGSFVEKNEFRDIDIAVYLKDLPASILEYELQMEAELITSTNCIIDVRVLNTSPLSFRYHVIRKGIPLVVRDEDERAEFQEATLSRYFDFAFYRDMYLRETLGLAV